MKKKVEQYTIFKNMPLMPKRTWKRINNDDELVEKAVPKVLSGEYRSSRAAAKALAPYSKTYTKKRDALVGDLDSIADRLQRKIRKAYKKANEPN